MSPFVVLVDGLVPFIEGQRQLPFLVFVPSLQILLLLLFLVGGKKGPLATPTPYLLLELNFLFKEFHFLFLGCQLNSLLHHLPIYYCLQSVGFDLVIEPLL